MGRGKGGKDGGGKRAMGEGLAIPVKIEIERGEKRGGRLAWQSSDVRTSADSDRSNNEKAGRGQSRSARACSVRKE